MRGRIDPMVWVVVYALVVPLTLGALANWAQLPAIIRLAGGQTGAAWAQAIGSFAALVVAFYLGGRQHRIETQKRAADRAEFLGSLRALANLMVAVAQDERAQLLSGPEFYAAARGNTAPYEDLATAFSAVSHERIGNAEGVLAVLQMIRACRRAEHHMNAVSSEVHRYGKLDPETRAAIGDWFSGIQSARLMIAKLR